MRPPFFLFIENVNNMLKSSNLIDGVNQIPVLADYVVVNKGDLVCKGIDFGGKKVLFDDVYYSYSDKPSIEYLRNGVVMNEDCSRLFVNQNKLEEFNMDLSNVSAMTNMFNSCRELTAVNITSCYNVVDGRSAFYNCSKLQSINLLHLDSLENASYMFNNCGLLDIELGPTEKLKTVDYMFYSNLKLEKVKVSSLPLVTNLNNMFSLCWSLDDVEMPDMPELVNLGNFYGESTFPHHTKFGNCPKLTAIKMGDFNGFYDSHHDNMSVTFGDLDSCTSFSGLSKLNLCTTTLGVLGAENLDYAFSGTKSSTIHISGMPNATSATYMFAAGGNAFDGHYTREIEIGPAPKITDLYGWFSGRYSFAFDDERRESEYWDAGLLSFKYKDLSSVTALTRTFANSSIAADMYNNDFAELIKQAKSMDYTFAGAYIPKGLSDELFANIESLNYTFDNAKAGLREIEIPSMPKLTAATKAFSNMYTDGVIYHDMPKLSATYEDLVPVAYYPKKVILPNFTPTNTWPVSYAGSSNKLSAITELEFHDLKGSTISLGLCSSLQRLYVEKAAEIHFPSGRNKTFNVEIGEVSDISFEGKMNAHIRKLTGDSFGNIGSGRFKHLEIDDATALKLGYFLSEGYGSDIHIDALPNIESFRFYGWDHIDIPSDYPSVTSLTSGFVVCNFFDNPNRTFNFPNLVYASEPFASTSGCSLEINAPIAQTFTCTFTNTYQKLKMNTPQLTKFNIANFNVRSLQGSFKNVTEFYNSFDVLFMDLDIPLQSPKNNKYSSSSSGFSAQNIGPESWVKLALRNTESADTIIDARTEYWSLTSQTDTGRYMNLLASNGYKVSGYTATDEMPEYSKYFGNKSIVHDTEDHDSLSCCTVYYSGATNLVDVTSDFSNTKCTALMFAGCTSLSGFAHDLSSVKYAGKMFEGCTNLKSFSADMPSLISGYGMFDKCESLEYIYLGSVSAIPNGLFDGFNPTGNVVIELPNVSGSVPYIFKDPTLDMTKIHVKLQNITNIDNAFSGQVALESYSIDSPVLNSASGAFSGCTMLTGFTSDSKVLSSVSKCFSDTNIKSLDDVIIYWPEIKKASYAFANTPIESVELDMSEMTDASYIFNGCKQLKDIEVTLPSSGLSGVFYGATAATAVTMNGITAVSDVGLYNNLCRLSVPDAVRLTSCLQLQSKKEELLVIEAPKAEYAYQFIYGGGSYSSGSCSVSGCFSSLVSASSMFDDSIALHDSYLDMPLVTAFPFNTLSANNITGRFDSIELMNGTFKRLEPSEGFVYDFYMPSLTAAHNIVKSLTADTSNLTLRCPNLKDVSSMFYQATVKPQLMNIDFSAVENASSMFSNGYLYELPFKEGDLSAATNISKMFYQTGSLKRLEYKFPSATNADSMFCYNTAIKYIDIDLPVCTSALNMFYGSGLSLTYLGMSADSLTNFNSAMGIWSGNTSLTDVNVSLDSTEHLNSTFVNLSGGLSSFTLHNASNCSGMVNTFKGCSKLKDISLPDSMEKLITIAGMAQGCSSLSSLSMSENTFSAVVSASSAFMSCQNLRYFEAYMPSLSSASNMFSGCNFRDGLKLYAPHVSLLSLGLSGSFADNAIDCTLGGYDFSYAFGSGYTSSAIKSFKGTYANAARADGMFTRCSYLQTYSANTPSLTSATNMFSGCSSLATVWGTFDNVKKVPNFSGYSDFNKLSSFTSNIKVDKDIKGMFYYKGALQSVSGDWESVTAASGTFQMCSSLTRSNIQVSMPNLEIADEMFSYCYGLTDFDVDYPKLTSADNLFLGCTGLTSVTLNLPSLLIGSGLFQNCKNLQSVSGNLSGVSSLNYAFAGCSSLTDFDIVLPVSSAVTVQLSACPLTVRSVSGLAKNCVAVESGCTINFSQATKDLSASTNITTYFDQLISKGYTVSGYTKAS